MIDQSTICAISTAPGNAAIAVIRMSGNDSIAICDSIFHSSKNKILEAQKANTIHFGTIKDGEEIVDEVLVSVFHAPHSFTGEDSIEISCHGSPYIQQRIIQLLISQGARMANPGEYTQRAFVNGKMDLSQAEAIADLIATSSAAAHRLAIQQMRGGFSAEISKLREHLLKISSLIELELDFSEEDVEFADRKELQHLAHTIDSLITNLINSFTLGNVIKNGVPVAIVGNTNVGKSTLLNALLKEDKAIVSDIEGTTRDVIEDTVNIQGITFRFIDTAGIRNTNDTVETLGIERTFDRIKKASVVLLLVDAEKEIDTIKESVEKISSEIDSYTQKFMIIVNKIDTVYNSIELKESILLNTGDYNILPISAKENINIDKLIEELVKSINFQQLNESDVIVTNARHYEALCHAKESIERVNQGLTMGISGDFLSQDLRETLHHLGTITGEISTNDILGNIFKNFCIGK